MSSMHTPQTAVQPFAVVRRGFDREQVVSAVTRLEAEVELLRADRDAAVARAERAATELERERERVRDLETRVADLGRVPTTSEQMSDRLSTMLGLATAEAESIRDTAHATADRILTEAEEEAWRLRETAQIELTEIRERNSAVRSQHDAAIAAATARGQEILVAAERKASQLDDQAARRRAQIDEDHRLASDLRRREALREDQSRQAATAETLGALHARARDEASTLVAEAARRAGEMIREATAYTSELRDLRRTVLADLASVRARLEPLPSRVADEEPLPGAPDLSSNDG